MRAEKIYEATEQLAMLAQKSFIRQYISLGRYSWQYQRAITNKTTTLYVTGNNFRNCRKYSGYSSDCVNHCRKGIESTMHFKRLQSASKPRDLLINTNTLLIHNIILYWPSVGLVDTQGICFSCTCSQCT